MPGIVFTIVGRSPTYFTRKLQKRQDQKYCE